MRSHSSDTGTGESSLIEKILISIWGLFCAALLLGVGIPMLYVGLRYGFGHYGGTANIDEEQLVAVDWIFAVVLGGMFALGGIQILWMVLRGKFPEK
jgi:hypothetical protein